MQRTQTFDANQNRCSPITVLVLIQTAFPHHRHLLAQLFEPFTWWIVLGRRKTFSVAHTPFSSIRMSNYWAEAVRF